MLDKSMVAVGTGKSEMVMVKNGTAPYTATSKDNKVATASVKDNKITVTGLKAGTTTVTISDKNKLNATHTHHFISPNRSLQVGGKATHSNCMTDWDCAHILL